MKKEHLVTIGGLILTNIMSQVPLLVSGSIPDVGSSKNKV